MSVCSCPDCMALPIAERYHRFDADDECTCGHIHAQHGDDGCHGTGRDLDPMYGRPSDEACLCQSFELLP